MWRRLCLDVSETGGLIGGSVEFYDDSTRRPGAILVMDGQWVLDHDVAGALVALLNDGWLQPPLPLGATFDLSERF
jgi:hypothetical protein